MQYYRNKQEIKIYNWFMIQIENFNLSYMLKYDFLRKFRFKYKTKKQKTKLYESFKTILHSLSFVNNDILLHNTRWKSQLTQLKIKLLLRDNKPLVKLEQVFRDYLQALQQQYEEFELKVYYFNPKWRELIKRFTVHMDDKAKNMCLKLLKDFENISFYDWNQYNLLINQEKYLLLAPFTTNQLWNNEFILSKQEKYTDLVMIDNHLIDIFQSNNLYEHYQFVRLQLFDLNNLKTIGKPAEDPFKQLAKLGSNIGFDIDSRKKNLAEYEGFIEMAMAKAKPSKPKEGGHGN